MGQERFRFGYRDRYLDEYKVGVLTSANVVVVPPLYRSVTKHGAQYVVQTTRDSLLLAGPFQGWRSVHSLYGLVAATGQLLLPCRYEWLRWVADSLVVVQWRQREALFTDAGHALTGFDYRAIGDFHEGLALARAEEGVGFLDRAGRLVIRPRWPVAEAFDQGRALVGVQGKWGAIDTGGRVVVRPRYTYAEVQAKLVAERRRQVAKAKE